MRTQLRGNCQCCGREQAIKNGAMAHHGYTVKNGWFEGACNGHLFEPMQVSTHQTYRIIAKVQEQIVDLKQEIARLQSGKAHPAEVKSSCVRNAPMVPWAEAQDWQKRDALASLIYSKKNRIRAGEDFIAGMDKLAKKVHGQPLREVTIGDAPDAIPIGEKRRSPGGRVMTVVRVDGARVYWGLETVNPKKAYSWTGSSAWRKYELL